MKNRTSTADLLDHDPARLLPYSKRLVPEDPEVVLLPKAHVPNHPAALQRKLFMVELVAELCVAALLAGLTLLGIMVLFLALCIIMRAIALVLSYDFAKALKLPR